jgi:hypothetical protein
VGTNSSPQARARVTAAAALTLASLVLSSGAAAAISYRSAHTVSGTLAPASADHHDTARHVRGQHVRTAPAPTSLGSGAAGGRITYR